MADFPLVDFGLIVALHEEFMGLQQAIGSLKPADRGEVRTFYRKLISSRSAERTKYHTIITYLNVMGQKEAGAATGDLLLQWRPQHTILVGIAGGLHEDVSLGDVIVSTVIWDYEPRKETAQGTNYRPEVYNANKHLLGRITEMCLNTQAVRRWQQACKKKNGTTPKVHCGIFASGNAVIADQRMRETLKRLNDKILGVEMEAANAFAASANFADPRRIIMVRGVCDHADPDKAALDQSGKWRPIACFNPAKFVQEFIRFGNIKSLRCDEFEMNTTSSPRIDANFSNRPGNSYPYFAHLLRPIGPLIDLNITVRAFNSAGTLLNISRSIWTEINGRSHTISVSKNFSPQLNIRVKKSKPDGYSLHLEIEGEPERIEFDCKTEVQTRSYSWKAQ